MLNIMMLNVTMLNDILPNVVAFQCDFRATYDTPNRTCKWDLEVRLNCIEGSIKEQRWVCSTFKSDSSSTTKCN